MTDEEKLALYDAGYYACAVPPVPHGSWVRMDWVRWIDATGFWHYITLP